MRGRVVLRLVVALATTVLLAACSQGKEPTKTMTVVGTEMKFDAPDRVASGTYDVRFRNAGAIYHELAFRDPSGRFVARRSIRAGESVVMEVELKPGTYELGCYELGHYEAGMHKTLVVERAPGEKP